MDSSTRVEHILTPRYQSILIAEALWSLTNGILRIAACLLLMRIFSRGLYWKIARIVAVVAGAHTIASFLQIFLICHPFAAQWSLQVLGVCGDQVASFAVLESVGLLLDVSILMIPIVPISRLQMSARQKVYVMLVLEAGAS